MTKYLKSDLKANHDDAFCAQEAKSMPASAQRDESASESEELMQPKLNTQPSTGMLNPVALGAEIFAAVEAYNERLSAAMADILAAAEQLPPVFDMKRLPALDPNTLTGRYDPVDHAALERAAAEIERPDAVEVRLYVALERATQPSQ